MRIRIRLLARNKRLKALKSAQINSYSINFTCYLKVEVDPDTAYYFDADPDPAYHVDIDSTF